MDIEHAVREKFGRVQHSGRELVVSCPLCGADKLSINSITGYYQCWHGCLAGRHIERLLGRNDIEYRQHVEVEKDRDYSGPGEVLALDTLEPDHQALAYLKRRGFDPAELQDKWGVAYCCRGRKYAGGLFDTSNTIAVPVWDHDMLVAWQCRLLYNPDTVPEDMRPYYGFKYDAEKREYAAPPKYFTMPGYHKRAHLWGSDWARQGELVVVTEGVFDAMRVGRSAVAAFGKGVSDEQVQLLQDGWKQVVLLLDPDAEEDQRKVLRKLPRAVSVVLNGYKDAGEAPRGKVWEQIRHQAKLQGIDIDRFQHFED